MKKVMNKINLAIISLMISAPAFAAQTGQVSLNVDTGMCGLLTRLHDVFNILRIMAFIGAAFYIAGWAWEFISSGKVDMAKVKERGIGLLVGFSLLFLIGLVLTFIMSASGAKVLGCDIIGKW